MKFKFDFYKVFGFGIAWELLTLCDDECKMAWPALGVKIFLGVMLINVTLRIGPKTAMVGRP